MRATESLTFLTEPSSFPGNCSAIASRSTQYALSSDGGPEYIANFLQFRLIPLPRSCRSREQLRAVRVHAMQHTTENFFIIRADHTFSTKDRIFSTYLFDKASQSEPDEYQSKLLNNPMFRQMVAIEENHVFSPSLLNSFRVGFNRDNVESPSGATAINPAAADTTLGFIPGTTVGQYHHRLGWPCWLLGRPGCGGSLQIPLEFVSGVRQLVLHEGKALHEIRRQRRAASRKHVWRGLPRWPTHIQRRCICGSSDGTTPACQIS